MPLTKSLAAAGDLVFFHDFRAGHCANQAGYSAGAFDGVVAGAAGHFRTGVGYETSHDFAGGGVDASLGYIRVLDNAAFFPPAGGMCLVASYLQSSATLGGQIIGQGGDVFGNTSWALRRTAATIDFVTSDGAALSTFAYALAAVPGQIETVTVRYTGGVGVGNCTISVLAPTPSASTGQITAVPQNVAQPVGVGSYSTSTAYPFFGTIRYCAFVRGAQTAAILAALAAELEVADWPDAIEHNDNSGSVADRQVQYMSKFGVDASIADEGTGIERVELSNSHWIFTKTGVWRVSPYHSQNAAAGGPADVQKALTCVTAGQLWLPREYFSVDTTATLAAYGTWDFWVYHWKNTTTNTFVVYDINGVNDDGYVVRIATTKIYLGIISGGVWTTLIATGVVYSESVPNLIHIRVTRTLNGDWKLFYQLCDAYGVPGRWVLAGTVSDATITTSDGIFLDYDAKDALMLGNHRSEKAIIKWRGVVDAL